MWVIATAFAVAICFEMNPSKVIFVQEKMRSHLIECLENQNFCNFPFNINTNWKKEKITKSRKENSQKLTQLSSRSHPRHLVGKRTAQKDITIDTTSDSQVNSNFPNRWSTASLTLNNYFYLYLYLHIT